MSYRYEVHMHSSLASACGRSKGSETAHCYKERGYDGIFITDHFYRGNTCIDRSLPWPEWVDSYAASHREAKAEGDRIGLKVFFGWEITYGTGEDFLIYGLTPEWLKKHPEVIDLTQEEQYALVHSEGGLVVQAHPFRERSYMREIVLHPNHSDAWEVANASNEAYQDANAMAFAKARGLTMTCGSDTHSVAQLNGMTPFPMITEQPLGCERDYADMILSGTGWTLGVPEERFAAPKEPALEVFLRE